MSELELELPVGDGVLLPCIKLTTETKEASNAQEKTYGNSLGIDNENECRQPGQQRRFPESLSFENMLNTYAGDGVVSTENLSPPEAVNNFDAQIQNKEDTTEFRQVIYLGCSQIDAPRSEAELQKIMAILNNTEKSNDAVIDIVISIASSPQGHVRLFDAINCDCEIESFPISRILFCSRGHQNTAEKDCFAFTVSRGEGSPRSLLFCTHVFRCSIPEAVSKVLLCFAAAFRVPRPLPGNSKPNEPGDDANSNVEFQFEIFLEIKEDDGKSNFIFSPIEKNCFKLRVRRQKKVILALQQIGGPRILTVQKCFGLLLAAGRNVQNCDMHLLEVQSMNLTNERTYVIEALWIANNPQFEILNVETPKDTRVFFTFATDVILAGISEPSIKHISFLSNKDPTEISAYVLPLNRKPAFFMNMKGFGTFHGKQLISGNKDLASSFEYEMVSLESSSAVERKLLRSSVGRSPSKMAANLVSPAGEDESDSDEALLSGSGDVTRECSEDVLTDWGECLQKWRHDRTSRPKELSALIRNGIPDALRGEVWQLLANADRDPEMMDTYRLLLAKECPCEQTILRDIHRTFPAHDHFKESGGIGQDSLYKLAKAYSLYDEEVSYCQGISFLCASLLLHMPEEQAFCVLVKIMFDYSLRELFKQAFEALHLRFYQLERLIEKRKQECIIMCVKDKAKVRYVIWMLGRFPADCPDCVSSGWVGDSLDYIPDLFQHFLGVKIRTGSYLLRLLSLFSVDFPTTQRFCQWFLTLFTAKFPLSMVFHIIDLFLSEGINTIFHISVALLKVSKRELLQLPNKIKTPDDNTLGLLPKRSVLFQLDFECCLKYFRVTLPRKYRTEANAKDLIQQAVKLKISHKRLTKYEKEYIAMKQQEAETQDPLERLERENLRMKETIMRLERENDDLAHELVTSKIDLRNRLDTAEDSIESLQKQVEKLTSMRGELDEENKQLLAEADQIKEMYRKELQKFEEESSRNAAIITNYKQICSDLSHRLEREQAEFKEKQKACSIRIKNCDQCSQIFQSDGTLSPGAPALENGLGHEESDAGHRCVLLELELAQTKLALVESECEKQDLTHKLNNTALELQERRHTWLTKTISSLKEVAKNPAVTKDLLRKDSVKDGNAG